MQRQFTLTLTKRWKATGVVVGGLALLGLVVAAVASTVGRCAPVASLVGVIVLLFGWIFWLMPKAAQRFCAQLAVVTVDEEGLTVRYPATAAVRRIGFAAMASYSFAFGEDFTIRPQQGPALNLHLNHKLHPQGLEPLMEFDQYFQWAVADYQRRHPEQPPILRLGFFNHPLATVLLALFAYLLGWLGWRLTKPAASEGEWGAFLLALLGVTLYALLWHHHRVRVR